MVTEVWVAGKHACYADSSSTYLNQVRKSDDFALEEAKNPRPVRLHFFALQILFGWSFAHKLLRNTQFTASSYNQ